MTDPIFVHGDHRHDRLVDQNAPHRLAFAVPLLPVCVSIFLLSGLVYHHVQNGGTAEASNLWQSLQIGLYRLLGFVPAAMLCVLTLAWSSIWFFTGKLERPLARLVRLFALTISLAILVNLEAASLVTGTYDGLVGGLLAPGLVRVFTPAGATLLVSAASVGALLLATDFFFFRYFDNLAVAQGGGAAAQPVAVSAKPTVVAPRAGDGFTAFHLGGVATEQEVPDSTEVDTPEVHGSLSPEHTPELNASEDESFEEMSPRRRRRVRLEDLAPDVVEDEPLASRANQDVLPVDMSPDFPVFVDDVKANDEVTDPVQVELGQMETQDEHETVAETKTETAAETETQTETETETEAVAEAKTEPEAVAEAADETEAETDADADADAELEPEHGTEPVAAFAAETGTEAEAAGAEPESETEAAMEAVATPGVVSEDLEQEPDAESETGPRTEPDAVTATADPATEPDTDLEPVAASETEDEAPPLPGQQGIEADEPILEIPRPATRQGLLFGSLEPELVEAAVALVRDTGRANATFLQRRLRVDYDTAVRLLDSLRLAKVIDGAMGDSNGRVLMLP